MRGKLRDKRSTSKKETFNRESLDRRRPYKRDTRTAPWPVDQYDVDDELDFEEEDEEQDQKLPPLK